MIDRKEIAEEILNNVGKKRCKHLTEFLDDWTKGLYVILRVIDKSETEVVAGDLSKALNVSTARMAVALSTLDAKKWIKKHKSNSDARKTVVQLTDLGRIKLKEREEQLVQIISEFLEKLDDSEVNQLFNIIKKTVLMEEDHA